MKIQEAYSVLITTDKGKRGTGTLFYAEGSEYFYVLTCAHVIFTSQKVFIHLLEFHEAEPVEWNVEAERDQFYFSPIDQYTVIGDDSTHTCDVAVIRCPKGDIPLSATRYAVYPMVNGERVMAIGYPCGTAQPVYLQQDELMAKVLRVQSNQNYFVIRVTDDFLNAADRESELKGFSGSPVWDKEKLDESVMLFGGLIAMGVGANISRGRIHVMSARLLQSLMKEKFGVILETRLPNVPSGDVAPGYVEAVESPDKATVRAGWIENERQKAQTYIDVLQLQKAVDTALAAIGNSEFEKCTVQQKYRIYSSVQEAYRLAREYDTYDRIAEQMVQKGITDDRDELMAAVRYYEAQDPQKALVRIQRALEKNPNGNKERILELVIRAETDETAEVSMLSQVLGPRDQLLVKPEDKEEEEFLYQMLGFVLSNRFRQTERAVRCINRAFEVSGNYIILETSGLIYYQHAIKNAIIEESTDKIDPRRIDQRALYLARDAFLQVFSSADEMWLKGTFRRAGLQIFKCFYFLHDNFRVYKHYQDVIRYSDFTQPGVKRDIQICYLDVAVKKGPVDLSQFDALTDHDKQFYELVMLLEKPMQLLCGEICRPVPEKELLDILADGESRLRELVETQTDDRLGYDRIHSVFANLYGTGMIRYHWQTVEEVKRHCAQMKDPAARKAFQIYIEELQTDEFEAIEKKYRDAFEEKKDIVSFVEWSHFYIRRERFDLAKELYDSVFTQRSYLIKDQPEYFYRLYIDFTLAHQFDLTPAIRCAVAHRDAFKDSFIYAGILMELKFATCTFNDPELMLEDAKMLLEEGIYSEEEYREKCLVIQMLNCKPKSAEQFALHGGDPTRCSDSEARLFIWKGARVVENPHCQAMSRWSPHQIFEIYANEAWLRDPMEILEECGTAHNRAVVADLWTLYILEKCKRPQIMGWFQTIYVTHCTVAAALEELRNVNDDDIRRVLNHLSSEKNVVMLSPTLERQLEVRSPDLEFAEMHRACLLAQEMNCPALVGEFRFPIPENLRAKIIRPCDMKCVIMCTK